MTGREQNRGESLADFVGELDRANIKLWVDGSGALRCKAPKGAVTEDLLKQLEERKEDIISLLLERSAEDILHEPIPDVEERQYYPLSAAQKRMFILNKIDRKSTAYNLTQVLKIRGSFDKERFLDIFRQLVLRHESLRTSFGIIDEQPVQIVHRAAELIADYEELSGKETDMDRVVSEFIRPYDLETFPLFRLKIVKLLQPDEKPVFYVIIDMHHIISDGISVAILVREINAFYAGKSIPRPEKNYRDYAAWNEKVLSGGAIQAQKEYWLKQLEGELPVLNLPLDYPRPQKFSFEGDSIKIRLDAGLTQRLNGLARENRVTLFSVLLAVYYILIYKYTGQKDSVIGTSTAGRRHADINNIIGVFINTVALRSHIDSRKSFVEFLREVGADALKAFDNQDYPFEKLVEDMNIPRDPGRNPVFDAMFILQNINIADIKAGETEISYFDYKKKVAQFDITITATESRNGIELEFNYCTGLFKRETIERLGSHFVNIAEYVTRASSASIGGIDMLSPQERKQLIEDFNCTGMEYRENAMIHRLFEERAGTSPQAVALVYKDRQLTYAELDRRAGGLARTLAARGVTKDSIVGLMVERSFNLITGILGILKAGGAYLPLDPEYPADRISYMLEDSGTRILLSQKRFYERLEEGERPPECEFMDMDDESIFDFQGEAPVAINDSHSLAYVIYTSGSTGKPKGVMLEHRSVINFIKGITAAIDFNASDTILCLTTVSFDIFVLEALLPLAVGMKIVIADEARQRDSRLLNSLIADNGVDMLQITPSRLQLLISGMNGLPGLQKLKAVMVGGEAFPQKLLTELKKLTGARINNMYAPTETTVWSAVGELTDSTEIDIGGPIANTRIYILDGDGRPVPAGVPGELHIAGDGLARGYLHRPELTDEKFVPDPFYEGRKMYRTGDMARWLANGKIECLGRMDQQVKIRGYRIEPEEIEKHFAGIQGVRECVVVAKADEAGNKYLAGYYSSAAEIPVSDIRSHLSGSLPEYMVPEIFVHMEKLPFTPNGKIDRKALPEPGSSRPKLGTEYKSAVSDSEKLLSGIWQRVLKRELVGVEDNFFELGGNSLTLIKMHGELDRAYPGKVSVTDVFAHPTIAKLAGMIDGQRQEGTAGKGGEIEEETREPAGKNPREIIVGQEPRNTDIAKTDIAIIGMAGRFGSAGNPDEFWEGLKAGTDFIRKLPEQRKNDCDVYVEALINSGMHRGETEYFDAAFLDRIDGFDCHFFNISPREADLMDPHQRFFLETAWEAMEDAGYGGKKLTGSKTGVFVGHSTDFGVEYKNYGKTVSSANDETAVSGNIRSIIGSRISYILDLKGPSVTVDTACSSALVAVHMACGSLRNGECETALAGGCKLSIIPERNSGEQGNLGIASNGSRSRTFDDASDGIGFGEGGGVVLLKLLNKAVEDGDNIHAVIKGSAINQDGASVGITAPNMAAQEEVIISAWKAASIDPETVTYIETHGTGTKLGDPIEVAGISKAFEHYTQKKQFCTVASVKTNIGHLDNASGIVSLIKGVLSLKNRELPPTLHFRDPNRKISFENSPVYVNDRLRSWETNGSPRRCGISSFGLSGTNCHLVLEEYCGTDAEVPVKLPAAVPGKIPEKVYGTGQTEDGRKGIMVFSAKSLSALKALAERYCGYLDRERLETLESICYTANTGRGHYNVRLALVAESMEDLKYKMALIREKGPENTQAAGIFFGESRIVSPSKQKREAGEITLEEARMLSLEASSLVGGLLDEKDISIFNRELERLGRFYTGGADIGWDKLYSGSKYYKVSLPAYPFSAERHWVKPDRAAGQVSKANMVNAYNTGNTHNEGNTSGDDNIKNTDNVKNADNINYTDYTAAMRVAGADGKMEYRQVVLKGRASGTYSEMEMLLGGIWGEALGFEEINIYDDFFELGGNSLVAIKVETYGEKCNIALSSEELYEYKTIEQLALLLDSRNSGMADGSNGSKERQAANGGMVVREKPGGTDRQEAIQLIENIEPFNEMFYRSCFYNSFFPVINHFGKSILPYLANDVPVYSENAERADICLGVEYRSLSPVSRVLEEEGVYVETRDFRGEILKDIITALTEKKPVVVWVDCFYESIRTDLFRKQHWPHTILIYGFDERNKIFHVIEHSYRDSLSYEKRAIGFEDMFNMSRGYARDLYGQVRQPAVNIFYPGARGHGEPKDENRHLRIFRQNVLEGKDIIYNGIECLHAFNRQLGEICGHEDVFFEDGEKLIGVLNAVLNAKEAERYKVNHLLGPEHMDINERLKEIIDNWAGMRRVLAKSIYAHAYNAGKINEAAGRLSAIYELELEYYRLLVSCLEALNI